jgi:hypothetical protein
MLPLDAKPGQFIEEAISNAIREADRVIVVASEASLSRAPVRREIPRALRLEDSAHLKGNPRPVFIPVPRDNHFFESADDLVQVLREYWAADFRRGRSYSEQLERLLDALRVDTD